MTDSFDSVQDWRGGYEYEYPSDAPSPPPSGPAGTEPSSPPPASMPPAAPVNAPRVERASSSPPPTAVPPHLTAHTPRVERTALPPRDAPVQPAWTTEPAQSARTASPRTAAAPARLPSDTAYMGTPERAAPPPRPAGRGCLFYLGRALLWSAILFVVFFCIGLSLALGVYILTARELPTPQELSSAYAEQSTKIYDRNGGLLFEIFDADSGRHTNVTPDRIPLVLKQATLATEDPSFYTNPGVDWYGVARAIYYLARYQRPLVGGSTITQQLVKRTFLTPEVTIERKLKEAVLALEVTRHYTKDEILAFYLNSIYYGNLSYGIQAASLAYFKKDVSELDLAEASLLAGLPQAPSLYDPCVNPDQALGRQQVVLGLMVKEGYIAQAQADAAASETAARLASDAFKSACTSGFAYGAAPHFVEYVRSQLEQEYGPEVVYKGGLQVYTTLDPALQKIIEQEASKQIAALKSRNVNSAAAVAIDPRTGEILAMLGSVDFDDPSIDGQVNVAARPRQPGSSIKPITYVAALERGWTAATPIYDLRSEFPNGAQPPYVPVNYDGKEHGLVSVRTALANSFNVPAVKTLFFVGVPEMVKTAERFGITTFGDPNRYGLALTLGGGEVRLVELTGAYATLANGGRRAGPSPFRRIVDGSGRTILDLTRAADLAPQVVDPRYAYLMTDILSDNAARTPAFGANSPLLVSRPAFVKTGTTNEFKDNWTLGGTTEFVLGVWVGNPRNQAMRDVSGITGAAPIWHNVVERVYKELDPYKSIPPHDFPAPAGLVRAEICTDSGLLVTPECPADHRRSEIFLENQAPTQPDDVWGKLPVDITNNQLANEMCPPEIVEQRVFARLHQDPVIPYDKVQEWSNAHGYPAPPSEVSPCTMQLPQPEPPDPFEQPAPTEPPLVVVPTNPPPPPPPAGPVDVRIADPDEGQWVNGQVTVIGVARVPDLAYWVVEVGKGNEWRQVGSGNQPVFPRGQLARFNARQLNNELYILRLIAVDSYGRQYQSDVRIRVNNSEPPTDPPKPKPTKEPTKKPKQTRTPSAEGL